MTSLCERLNEWVGQVVVLDCASPYVVMGEMVRATDDFIELRDADLHDLRDTKTTRELYIVKAVRHGVARNRSLLLVRMAEVVGIARLTDVYAG